MDVRKVMDEKGNEINEEAVIKEEVMVQSLNTTTEEKPQGSKDASLIVPRVGADDRGKNKTESNLNTAGKNDESQKLEREEKIRVTVQH